MQAESADIGAMFTARDGAYHFARWGRPIVPVVFGVDAPTLAVVKGAVEAVVTLADHKMAETDPDLGANLMVFIFRDWEEVLAVPNLDRLIDGLALLVERLGQQDAHHYRQFRFDRFGAIQACFCFVRMDASLAELTADAVALNEAVRMILTWSEQAFRKLSPLASAGGVAVLRPEVAAVIRAAYDPAMPVAARDASHALRLAARVAAQL